MNNKLTKKTLLIGASIISVAPFSFFVSCSNNENSIENQLLDLEIESDVQLEIKSENLSEINLLDLGINSEQLDHNGNKIDNYLNNSQLSEIFLLPDSKVAETNNNYTIFYSWDFTKKDIVSFDRSGNINFEVNVNVGLTGSTSFISRSREFTIYIEKTTIEEEVENINPNLGNPTVVSKPALRYVYNGIDQNGNQKKYEFQAVREDVFEKAKNFNIHFYSQDSLINNRPVIIENNAVHESAIDAYSVERLIEPPLLTTMDNVKYRFSIETAGFDELNPKKGIYKIKVSPEIDEIFNSSFIDYAKDKYKISFNKYYYYYEKNKTFQRPTENNITTHNNKNSTEANNIANSIASGNLSFMPTLKNPGLIIGKTAQEIVEINNQTPGGLFIPPLFNRQYSIEPIKPISISITSVSATTNEQLTFSMSVSVGNPSYEMSKTIDKTIDIKYFLL